MVQVVAHPDQEPRNTPDACHRTHEVDTAARAVILRKHPLVAGVAHTAGIAAPWDVVHTELALEQSPLVPASAHGHTHQRTWAAVASVERIGRSEGGDRGRSGLEHTELVDLGGT